MSNNEEVRKLESARNANTDERYLAFILDKDSYAIPLLQVKEVIEMQELTPVPQTPSYFKGIINLRGQVVSVVDLRVKLQVAKIENGPKTAIIILDIDPRLSLGVIVDRISSVQAFSAANLSEPPVAYNREHNENIAAVARREDKMTLILNLRSALNLDDLEDLISNVKKVSGI